MFNYIQRAGDCERKRQRERAHKAQNCVRTAGHGKDRKWAEKKCNRKPHTQQLWLWSAAVHFFVLLFVLLMLRAPVRVAPAPATYRIRLYENENDGKECEMREWQWQQQRTNNITFWFDASRCRMSVHRPLAVRCGEPVHFSFLSNQRRQQQRANSFFSSVRSRIFICCCLASFKSMKWIIGPNWRGRKANAHRTHPTDDGCIHKNALDCQRLFLFISAYEKQKSFVFFFFCCFFPFSLSCPALGFYLLLSRHIFCSLNCWKWNFIAGRGNYFNRYIFVREAFIICNSRFHFILESFSLSVNSLDWAKLTDNGDGKMSKKNWAAE